MATNRVNAALISALGGTIVEVIAGLNFWLYVKVARQLDAFHVRLERMLRFLLANSVAQNLAEPDKAEAVSQLVVTISTSPVEKHDDRPSVIEPAVNEHVSPRGTELGVMRGFLGLGATQIFTIFRNAPLQASIIALMFLLSVIVAVLGTLIRHDEKLSWLWVLAIFLLLLDTASWVIYESHAVNIRPISGIVLGIVVLGLALTAVSFAITKRNKPQAVFAQPICILASVLLLATSVYGTIFLGDLGYYRPPSVQISASISSKTSHTTFEIHVTAFSISMSSHVHITALGLPSTVSRISECRSALQRGRVRKADRSPSAALSPTVSLPQPRNLASCINAPCTYLSQCKQIFDATLPGDVSGNIKKKVIDGLILDKYKDISVRGQVCELANPCGTSDRYAVHFNIRLSRILPPHPSDKRRRRAPETAAR